MAHYYADICNPMHTDQCAEEDPIHSDYESDAQEYTDAVGENRAWVSYDGYKATTNVVGFTKARPRRATSSTRPWSMATRPAA